MALRPSTYVGIFWVAFGSLLALWAALSSAESWPVALAFGVVGVVGLGMTVALWYAVSVFVRADSAGQTILRRNRIPLSEDARFVHVVNTIYVEHGPNRARTRVAVVPEVFWDNDQRLNRRGSRVVAGLNEALAAARAER